MLGRQPPSVLLYGETSFATGEPNSPWFGAYTRRTASEIPPDSSSPTFSIRGLSADYAVRPSPYVTYYSEANLCNVRKVLIFHTPEPTNICRGIIIEYENGGQRALGQCRVGVDRVVAVISPMRLCLAQLEETASSLHGVRVEVQTDQFCHHSEDAGWKCYPLEGIIQFFFESHASSCIVVDGSAAVNRLGGGQSHTLLDY
jgi:hypothetical protein